MRPPAGQGADDGGHQAEAFVHRADIRLAEADIHQEGGGHRPGDGVRQFVEHDEQQQKQGGLAAEKGAEGLRHRGGEGARAAGALRLRVPSRAAATPTSIRPAMIW
ncbi:MAG: hypothetical protein MPW15_18375 [Candidatus Manganitrophus sp.]|nr:hypothetical protein [Candidatus Manganitrophus sp.]